MGVHNSYATERLEPTHAATLKPLGEAFDRAPERVRGSRRRDAVPGPGERRVGSAAGHQQADWPPIEDDEQRIGRRAHPQSDARRVLPQESDVVAADRDAGRTSE